MADLDLAIVGMGPRGLSVLERLVARLWEAQRGGPGSGPKVRVTVVEPEEPGAGRIWRTDQPEWLVMNTAAVEVSLYSGGPDEGPWRAGAGPSLHEWLCARAEERGEEPPSPNTYAPRRVYGAYLRDVFARITGHLPPGVEVRSLQGRARELRRSTDGRYRLGVSNGVELTVDKVVLTTGHPRNRAEDADRDLLDFASRHPRTRYLRGDSAADMDLAGIEPGEPVAVLGLGLTFYDVAALLTTGRGGAFRPGPDGRLRYHPSGLEPRLYAGSRSGLPLPARGRNQKDALYRYQPRFFTSEALAEARRQAVSRSGNVQLRFREQVLPLMLREVDYVYRTTAVRVRDGRDAAAEFAERYAEAVAGGKPAALDKVLAEAGLADQPAIDLEAMARPFRGERFAGPDAFHERLLDVLRADAEAAELGNVDGPLKAALDILRDIRGLVREAVEFSSLHPDSHRDEFLAWFNPINTMVSAGPPVMRIQQTAALIEAGLLTVVGPGTRIGTDEDHGVFTLDSPQVADSRVTARVLVDARIPRPNVHIDSSPLTRQMIADGLATAHVNINARDGARFTTGALAVTGRPFRVVDAAGRPSRDLYALGIPTEEQRWFTQIGNGRPGPMAGFHGDADAIAADVLRQVTGQGLVAVPQPSARPRSDAADAAPLPLAG